MGGGIEKTVGKSKWTVRRYLLESKTLANAALLCAPIVLAYEVGLLVVGDRGVRNAADALIDQGLMAFGRPVALAVNLIVLFVFLGFAVSTATRKATPIGLFVPVVIESGAYACLMAPALMLFSSKMLATGPTPLGPTEGLVLSLGAGFYEELVFRLVGVGCVMFLIERLFGRRGGLVSFAVLVVSSAAFAWFHHLGPGAEPFAPPVFILRTVAGLVLGALFILRGFGVACYTHVIYDVLCLVRF